MKRVMMMLLMASATLCSTGCNLANRDCGCGGPIGCRPCKMGWQRGGTDYQRVLGGRDCNECGDNCGRTGLFGGLRGQRGQYANAQPAGAGEASGSPMAQVAYPYYTTRGPRDFFLDNPPTIGR